MEGLFTTLEHAVQGHVALALAAAFVWGVASILLSPCHLSSVPLVVAFVSDRSAPSAGQPVLLGALFSLGVLATIAVLGLITAAAGRMLGDVGPAPNYLVALVLAVFGLHLLEILPLPSGWHARVATPRGGTWTALTFGLVFGTALGPCTFAFLAPLLGVVFKSAGSSFLYGVLLLLAYGIGHTLFLAFAATATVWMRRYLDWTVRTGMARRVRQACGVLLIVSGLYFVYVA